MIREWFERQRQRHERAIDWLSERAKHSWIFSLVLMGWMFWEILEHFVFPVVLAWFGASWLLERL